MISLFFAGATGAFLATVVLPVIPYKENPVNQSKFQTPFGELEPPPIIPNLFPFNAPNKTNSTLITVSRTSEIVPVTQDPVWSVRLIVNGETKEEIRALIGRADRQNLNRDTAGNKSPLPVGQYRIDRNGIEPGPFPDSELGRGYWIPITPLFQTNRSFLGIHQDPSWGKSNKESGTSGCIGLESAEHTKQVVQWIRTYNINTIVVES
jgi:hypothetical protein